MFQVWCLTSLCCLKEWNFLLRQSSKHLDFDSACKGTDGTEHETPSAACTHGADQPIIKSIWMRPWVTKMLMEESGQNCTFQESTWTWRGLQIWIQWAGSDDQGCQWLSQCRRGWTCHLNKKMHTGEDASAREADIKMSEFENKTKIFILLTNWAWENEIPTTFAINWTCQPS